MGRSIIAISVGQKSPATCNNRTPPSGVNFYYWYGWQLIGEYIVRRLLCGTDCCQRALTFLYIIYIHAYMFVYIMYNKKNKHQQFHAFFNCFLLSVTHSLFFLSTIGNELVVAAQGKYLQDTYRSDILKKMFIGCWKMKY